MSNVAKPGVEQSFYHLLMPWVLKLNLKKFNDGKNLKDYMSKAFNKASIIPVPHCVTILQSRKNTEAWWDHTVSDILYVYVPWDWNIFTFLNVYIYACI